MKRIIKTCALTFVLCLSAAFMFSQNAVAHSGAKYFKCTTYNYDRCTGCCSRTVTTYKTCKVAYRGCSYNSCNCCPQYYTYYKHYTYPVKSVKYYTAAKVYKPCRTCCSN